MARRERRDGRGESRDDYDSQPDRNGAPHEPERETLTALKAILVKVASVVKPLGLTPEESTDLVQRMYGMVLELDAAMAGETDESRKASMVAHVKSSVIRREDDVLVVDHPAKAD
ncbi:MAG TPA: hypothetical protein VFD74_08720 [Thermoleophilia bacterium]|nr:hypothetical protein [Thermoleophilia bacterium]